MFPVESPPSGFFANLAQKSEIIVEVNVDVTVNDKGCLLLVSVDLVVPEDGKESNNLTEYTA
jgi:hypothetical protein